MAVGACMCFCVCRGTWFSCSKPIAWPWSQRRDVCMSACECERPSLQDYFHSPYSRRGRPWWMRSFCRICKHTHTLPPMHEHTRLPNDSIWWWALDRKLESVKVRKLWTVTSTTAGYCHCLNSYTVITAGRLALIINLLHQIHFIISLSLTDRWDGPSSKWQSNWYKVIPFKDYSMNGS